MAIHSDFSYFHARPNAVSQRLSGHALLLNAESAHVMRRIALATSSLSFPFHQPDIIRKLLFYMICENYCLLHVKIVFENQNSHLLLLSPIDLGEMMIDLSDLTDPLDVILPSSLQSPTQFKQHLRAR